MRTRPKRRIRLRMRMRTRMRTRPRRIKRDEAEQECDGEFPQIENRRLGRSTTTRVGRRGGG
eukprot:2033969-Lingulodinium_polyedra.AAC.1